MNFVNCIVSLREGLILKHPIVKIEELREVKDDDRRQRLIKEIQLIGKEIIEKITDERFPVFNSFARATWENCTFEGRLKLKESGRKMKCIDFKMRKSRVDFATIVFLLSKAHKLLITQQTNTRRELFYENLKMFKSQRQVDRGMREVCSLLSAPTWELRISATSKGVVSGPVVLTLPDGHSVDCRKRGGVSIPQDVMQIQKISSSATWVLVVEKDACFQKLISEESVDSLDSCILITGKGFPDVNSRILVCKFWELLRIPVLVLVDADPHGFEIMCVYRFGSMSMSSLSGHLACPAVRWVGVHPSDIRPLLLDSKTLTLRDRKKIGLLLKRNYVEENPHLKTQLEILLGGNVKAEIEGLAAISVSYLSKVYLKNKIQCDECL